MDYHLAEACQNTFILFDHLNYQTIDCSLLDHAHQSLQKEERDDALLLSEGKFEDGTFHARMTVLGLDGALGEFCGNGARAATAYLYQKYPQVDKFFLNTPSGTLPLLKSKEGLYSIKLPPAKFQLNGKFIANRELFEKECGLCYVEMIEPHLTVQAKMTDQELFELGKTLNQRKDIFPLGINVNAWHILKKGSIKVKTYERGVQRLTQSCGTGSMSCASVYATSGLVSVSTPGGDLEITLEKNGIELKGPAFILSKEP